MEVAIRKDSGGNRFSVDVRCVCTPVAIQIELFHQQTTRAFRLHEKRQRI